MLAVVCGYDSGCGAISEIPVKSLVSQALEIAVDESRRCAALEVSLGSDQLGYCRVSAVRADHEVCTDFTLAIAAIQN